MRPTKLAMSAFGPYAGYVELDFTQLGDEGIYLLCGDTGAGKTTVFDAISFALFGKPSGEGREARTLRSDFAAPDTPTYVELRFTYRGREYRVKRNPEYERPKRRGEGTAKELAGAEFEAPGKPLVTRVRDVDEAVRDLLGIDREQFAQIVMIAQGDFRRLLASSTDERSTILRRVFGTEPYRIFQQALEARRSKLWGQTAQLREQVRTLAATVDLAPGDARADVLADWSQRDALVAGEVARLAEEAAAEDCVRLSELERDAAEEASRTAGLERETERARQAGVLAERLGRACDELEAARSAVAPAERALDDACRAAEECPELDAQAAVIRSSLPRYGELDEARSACAQAREEEGSARIECERQAEKVRMCRADQQRTAELIEEVGDAPAALAVARERASRAAARVGEAEALLDRATRAADAGRRCEELEGVCALHAERVSRCDRACDEVRERIERARADELILRDAPEGMQKARAEVESLEGALARACADQGERGRLGADVQRACEELKGFEETYRARRDDAARADAAYASVRRAFYDGQAGVLARGLVAGAPCPVCGSCEHPDPAPSCADVPSQQDLERAERARRDADGAMAQASEHVAAARSALDERMAALAAFDEARGGAAEVERAVRECEERLAQARVLLEEARIGTERLEEVRGRLSGLESDRDACDRELREAQDALSEARRAHAAAEATRDELKIGLDGVDEDTARTGLARAREDERAAGEAVQEAQRAVEDLERLRAQADRLRRMCAEAEEAGATCDAAAQEARVRAEGLAGRVASMERDLSEYEDRAQAQAACIELERRSGALRATVEEARDAHAAAVRAADAAEARRAELERQLAAVGQDGGPAELERLEGELARVSERRRALEDARGEVFARVQANERAARSLRANEEQAGEAAARYGELEALSQTANGRLSGKDKVSFETYVQAMYFDRVIAAANVRLASMTGGRYRLVRREHGVTQRGQTGLDLDVFDSYTGRAREASSLSGGESFKASLSLALGMSDVAQAHAGGIQLDTMFVDEGFGSLDHESLQLAIRTLNELSGNGKLVGIISHVDELKEAIDRKVVVERGVTGSTLRIEA